MQIIADLQLHSKYARAVSQNMTVPVIAEWAAKKGIGLVATGDWTHPLWFRELEAGLEEAAPGLFSLKGSRHPLFLLSTEVSCIYGQGGKTRRIHILIFAPSFETVRKVNQEFVRRGVNLLSDGRPIMGLSSQNVAELVLSVDERCLLIPAHAWTPWFSLYGSMSGFDSIEECFGEYAKYIYAIETGLSSDPAMNWRIAELENRQIVSFSDAHSPAKLGREATVFEVSELSYENIRKAIIGYRVSGTGYQLSGSRVPVEPKTEKPETDIRNPEPENRISYTIEFYPEEGKYHFTGHRNCGVKQTPGETKLRGTTCHVCGKPLTVGVIHRVEDLANGEIEVSILEDDYGVRWVHPKGENRPPYVMMVPLVEILSEAFGVGVSSQKVANEYEKLTQSLGPEFEILLQTKAEEIERISGPKVREAVEKVRSGDIFIDPGYDGIFGKVKIWQEHENEESLLQKDQLGLF